ncbi:hypothetical protein ALI44B_13220 [Leifsonia sp. ALI-44-B]|uniref:hypothetical protein n=1 Tax=Leifsonia sp. ALI-44-B TaxID=1933776 RepID=UPI00097BFAD8|nr:hypothetical protein [Leifsonia sp. ALI-44-B]ONI61379.1 hypothetical protein ALI44B_13220 [Leifsonia sp. ALI-44-B]
MSTGDFDGNGAEPDETAGAASDSGAARTRAGKTTRWLVAAALVLLLVGGGITALVMGNSQRGSDDAAVDAGSTSTAAPATPGSSAATPTPTSTSTPTPGTDDPNETPTVAETASIPSECRGLYDDATWARLTGDSQLPLNIPEMTHDQNFTGSDTIDAVFAPLVSLECMWGQPGEYGISTWVATVDEAEAAEGLALLKAEGYDCGDQLGGVRCTKEHTDGPMIAGHSMVLRGDAWVATHYVNITPDNYSEMVVGKLFGE